MRVIVKPTWNVDGWTGNIVDDNGIEWFTPEAEGWFSPVGVRNSGTDRATGDGIYSDPNRRNPRVIVLRGSGEAPTEAALYAAMDQFNGLLADGQLHPLVVDEPLRSLTASVKLGDGTNLVPISPREFEFQLVLIAPDPRKYGAALRQLPTGLATAAAGGVLWNGPAGTTGTPWNGPAGTTGLVYQSGSGNTGIVTLTNDGNAPAPLEFILTDPAEDILTPAITDTSTGRVISYGGTVTKGSSLAIDAEAGSVLLDGANRGPLLQRSEFFTIPPKSSIDVLFSAGSPAPSASLLARWRDTYI